MARKNMSGAKKNKDAPAVEAEDPVGGEAEAVSVVSPVDESSVVTSTPCEAAENADVGAENGEASSCCVGVGCSEEKRMEEAPVDFAVGPAECVEEGENGCCAGERNEYAATEEPVAVNGNGAAHQDATPRAEGWCGGEAVAVAKVVEEEEEAEGSGCASKGCCEGVQALTEEPVKPNGNGVAHQEETVCSKGCCGAESGEMSTLASSASSTSASLPMTNVEGCWSNRQDADGVADACCTPTPILVAPAKQVKSCCAPSSSSSISSIKGGGCSSKASSSSSTAALPTVITLSDRVKALKSDRENLLPSSAATPSLRGGVRVETLRLSIGGMTCSGCCTRIESFLTEQPGVFGVNVSLLTSRGTVDYDPTAATPEVIERLVTTLGFTAAPMPSESLATVILFVGQDPPERARQKLLGIDGVASVRDYTHHNLKSKTVDLATAGQNSVLVEYDPDVLGARTLVRKLSAAMGGFHVQASAPRPHAVESEEEEAAKFASYLLWSCVLSAPVLFVQYIAPLLAADVQMAVTSEPVPGVSWQNVVGFVCATPILFVVAYPIHESAFLALRFGSRVTMDVLISLSAFLAYVFSLVTITLRVLQLLPPVPEGALFDETFFEVTALLISLILLGRYIEKIVKAKAAHSIDALLKIQAKTAILLEPKENRESYIDVLLVERGDLLKVLPGARVPTDGVVVEGASSVDESMVTGESRKVIKEVGAAVIGGTINAQGVLVVRVTHTINESMLARIVHLVDEAQSSKCVSQSVADAVSSYFTTFIITVASVMFVVWYELASRHAIDTRGWAPLPFALRFAITILVISCPCAISLAVPTVIMVATTIGSQFGVLFKGGQALEALDSVDVIMFDKTGTLTTGKLQVVDFLVASSFTVSSSSSNVRSHHKSQHQHQQPLTPRKLWTYLAATERNSEHAIARAVMQYAKKVHTAHMDVSGFQSIPGCGVRGRVDGYTVCVGSLKWMLDVLRVDVPLDLAARNEMYQREGCVVVCLAIDNALCALVALQDTPRPEAHFVIDQLRQRKIQTWIVTGDQRETALSVAAQLGIPDVCVITDALPHQKVDKVRLLQGIGKRVAFVGDGVNDAPALAMAHVGVAIGAGTDVAIEAADLVLVKDDLRDLLNAVDLSRATNRLIRWNFTWGFLYNLLMMPLACGALYPFFGVAVPPAFAGLSELFSSVPVILFSLLLNFWRPPFPQTVSGGEDDASEGSFVAIDVRKDPLSEATPLLARH